MLRIHSPYTDRVPDGVGSTVHTRVPVSTWWRAEATHLHGGAAGPEWTGHAGAKM